MSPIADADDSSRVTASIRDAAFSTSEIKEINWNMIKDKPSRLLKRGLKVGTEPDIVKSAIKPIMQVFVAIIYDCPVGRRENLLSK